MFASKTPRDLNNDPVPHAERGGTTVFAPRPEFDHAQHNEPNPVLIAFREDKVLEVPERALVWSVAIDAFGMFGGWKSWGKPDHPHYVLTTATPEQIEHARRVVNLLKEAS